MPLLWLFSVVLGLFPLGRAERILSPFRKEKSRDVTGLDVSAQWQQGKARLPEKRLFNQSPLFITCPRLVWYL